MQTLWSFQALIQISLLKPSASSRRTPLFHAVTIKKASGTFSGIPQSRSHSPERFNKGQLQSC